MRYHYEKPDLYSNIYGQIYECDHPVYNRCTLYLIGLKGIAVIQQRYDPVTKTTSWSEIDPWLTDSIYLHPKFKEYFDRKADFRRNNLFPTVTVRQLMWSLKMKPMKKERWETVFDRKDI